MEFWKSAPKIIGGTCEYPADKPEEEHKKQLSHLASSLLIDDYNPNIELDVWPVSVGTNLVWPNKGELVSGSFISKMAATAICGSAHFEAEDIDIYFKDKADAQLFCQMNQMFGFGDFSTPMCEYGTHEGIKFNLIYGIPYDDPASLISRFDIRACAMAFDPATNQIHIVKHAVHDATHKIITFNPVPRAVSIRRLVKYIEKGFRIEKEQRLFFAELIRSDIYSVELEQVTRQY